MVFFSRMGAINSGPRRRLSSRYKRVSERPCWRSFRALANGSGVANEMRSELRRIYPPPARFGAEDVFRDFPELRTIQNAYAYLTHFEKQSQILSFGEGLFGFKEDRAPVPARRPHPPVVAFKTVDRVREAARLAGVSKKIIFCATRLQTWQSAGAAA